MSSATSTPSVKPSARGQEFGLRSPSSAGVSPRAISSTIASVKA
jgi:hypothetical protein